MRGGPDAGSGLRAGSGRLFWNANDTINRFDFDREGAYGDPSLQAQ
jgi:hypothetical protein